MRYSHISVAIPLLAELENLPALLSMLERQSLRDFKVYFCVNNPASWTYSDNTAERSMSDNNRLTLQHLSEHMKECRFPFTTIYRQWQGKKRGVGWARKVLFDAIAAECDDDELIVSLDADTAFSNTYLESVLSAMNAYPDSSALCVPYYHPLSGDEPTDRAMLRYEIYMRHYLINLLESSNPYAFTALGSAMAFPLWAYKRVGGITPLQGGEDFYLMQKFAKTGSTLLYGNSDATTVFPQGRASCRVPFGTGPAIAKGVDSMDSTYPLYSNEGFKAVAETFAMFPQLYDEDIETPMSDFLRQQLKTDNLWQPLRKNFKARELFVHACQERVDGLRILQYLKTLPLRTAEEELNGFCLTHNIDIPVGFSFIASPITVINTLRNSLVELENSLRKQLNNSKI